MDLMQVEMVGIMSSQFMPSRTENQVQYQLLLGMQILLLVVGNTGLNKTVKMQVHKVGVMILSSTHTLARSNGKRLMLHDFEGYNF